MNILGRFVTLRAIERDDLGMIVDMFNDPEMEGLVVGWSLPLSMHQQERWFESHGSSTTDLRFVIDTKEHGAVGIATLTDIDWKNRHAASGIKIKSADYRDRGIGTDTLMAIMRYAFDELQLVRLDTTWLAHNSRSRGMYKKCGWTEEGVRRKYIFKNGTYSDLIIGGILADDYHQLIKKNAYWG